MSKEELALHYCAVRFHPSVVEASNRQFGDPDSRIDFDRLSEQVARVYDIIGRYVPTIIHEGFEGPDDGFAEDLGMSGLNGTPAWLEFRCPVPNRRRAAEELSERMIREGRVQRNELHQLPPQGYADGGDFNCSIPLRTVFAGIPSGSHGRTNSYGFQAARQFHERTGSRFVGVPFDAAKALHLSTCSSLLGPNKDGVHHAACNGFVDARKYEESGVKVIRVDDDEAWGANALHIPVEGAPLIIQAGYPKFEAAVRAAGYEHIEVVPWDEVKKADGSLTCLGKFVFVRPVGSVG